MKIRSCASRASVSLPRAPIARPRVRTVVRTVDRVRYVPVYYTTTCGGCAPAQPVVYQAAYTACGGCAPAVAAAAYDAPRYYYPRYYATGCGGCYQAGMPRHTTGRCGTARYRHAHGYYRYDDRATDIKEINGQWLCAGLKSPTPRPIRRHYKQHWR